MNSRPSSLPRILFHLDFKVTHGGGVSVIVRELIRGLHEEFDCWLVSQDSAEEIQAAEVAPWLQGHIHWDAAEPGTHWRTFCAKVLEARPDLVLFHLGGNYSWLNRIPWRRPIQHLRRHGVQSVTCVHLVVALDNGLLAPDAPRWKKLLKMPLGWWSKTDALRQVAAEIAVSLDSLHSLRRWYPLSRSKFLQIYHAQPRDPALVGGLPMAERERIILNVGHIAFRKGQHFLVQAFAQLAPAYPEWKLVLIGPNDEPACQAKIEEMIAQFGLQGRVELLGQRPDARDFFRRAAVYVQPSLQEALPLALQEALAYGSACIATPVGGVPELVEDGKTGLLVAPGEVEELRKALERLLADDALRAQLSAAGPTGIQERGMTAEAMISRHKELYRRILHEHARA